MRSTQISRQAPVGLILAGGPGRRIGGNKAVVALQGEPLLHHALRAMRRAVTDVAIIAKPHTVLPRLDGAMVWIEPAEPSHPMLGVGEALALAGGRHVLVCPLDMPFMTAQLLESLAVADCPDGSAVMACARGLERPLVGRYSAGSAAFLMQAAHDQLPLEQVVRRLDPRRLEVDDETELFDVNTPDDLLQAAGMLDIQRRAVRA